MSELTLNTSSEQRLSSIYISIPEKLHQVPVLTNLISNYHLIVNFKAAMLDRKGTVGGWFNLTLEGERQDIENGLNIFANFRSGNFSSCGDRHSRHSGKCD